MEAIACQEIFQRAETGGINLVWSFMLQDETLQCPVPERKVAVLRLSEICTVRIGPDNEIYDLAVKFNKEYGLLPKDAIHLACAVSVKSDVFVTCDDGIIKKAKMLDTIEIKNPIDYIMKEV
jgi:predicted nucleic acid-binding protein